MVVVRALYHKGVFRPLTPVEELAEPCEVILSVRKPVDLSTLRALRGTVSQQDADAMQEAIDEARHIEEDW
jgi:predicted DNA-binding antitoxin AbrB/MazE fold protein